MSEMDGGTSILEGVGHKLQSLEERLQAANESHDRIGIVYGNAAAAATTQMPTLQGTTAAPPAALAAAAAATTTTTGTNISTLPGGSNNNPAAIGIDVGVNRQTRPTPHLPALETTPNRPRKMVLPVASRQPATETETDKKLKKIMKQTGILTINGIHYKTDIKDLEHLGDLGNGTSGNVVKMRHVPSGTIIAVKQMRRTGNTEENKRILMDLDVVLKSHDCKYIVQCLGCFVRDPDVWICMELMSMCFDKLLKLSKRSVPEDILGKVTVATVKALSYLKEKHNVIHRDVKPSNILIDERGNIKLCDFGISGRLVDSKAHTRSAGCAAYMAPERIDPKKPEYDIRADVWSLGITLVELATARSPYEGCNTDFEVLTKVLASDPPSLPYGGDYNFSDDFRQFVDKCLTKNHQKRPKYPELLAQPFIKKYEKADIDVAGWFQSIVETAGIRTHHRSFMPTTTTAAAAAKFNRNIAIATTTTTTTLTTNAMTINAKATTASALITPATITTTATATTNTHIPSYQQQYHQQLNRFKRDEQQQLQQLHLQQQQQQQQHYRQLQQQQQQQQHQQPSQLPQPIATYYANSNNINNISNNMPITTTTTPAATTTKLLNNHLLQRQQRDILDLTGINMNSNTEQFLTVTGNTSAGCGGSGGSGSGSSSANSSSPQSPPSVAYKDDMTTHIELNKLYRKSPFMQRKYGNGGGSFKYGSESPKKESMLTSIGQSIIRNLTTSPFSQKKHSHTVNTQQIDPLWRMPISQDVTVAFHDDVIDATATTTTTHNTNKYKSPYASPALGNQRRFPITTQNQHQIGGGMVGPATTTTATSATSLIPTNRNETNTTQRVQQQGNHSPIVLERFYHQQNQLREKELKRQQQHQQQQQHDYYTKHCLDGINPLLDNYLTAAAAAAAASATTTAAATSLLHEISHIPIATSHVIPSSSAYSNSSQSSSTQSSSACSQIANNSYEQQQQQQQQQRQQLTGGSGVGGLGGLGFGLDAGHLQYQPLPQQYITSLHNLTGNSTLSSTTTSSGSHITDSLDGGGGGGGNSKLGKLYARRQLQTTANCSSSGSSTSGIGSSCSVSATKEQHHYKDESGWLNSITGAMKRQFATYVKFQLHSTVSPAASKTSPPPSSTTTNGKNHRMPLSLYSRTISTTTSTTTPTMTSSNGGGVGVGVGCGGSSSGNTSNSNSPTELPKNRGTKDFYHHHPQPHPHDEYGTPPNGSFLRRYAASTAMASNSGNGGLTGATSSSGGVAPFLVGLDRRHRSPDPPPRYNRGQSPLLLRKNLLELSGQPPGSPLLNRRYVTASPPLPPPRRGSESVPGSPQHFRTRIHYTPEPQRRIYRTIDQ